MAMRDEAGAAAALWDEIKALGESLGSDDWTRPTPCARWSVKDVFAHMAGLQTAFDGSGPQPEMPEGWQVPEELSGLDAFTEAGVVARRDWSVAQVLAEVDLAKSGHVARLEAAAPDDEAMGPFGPTTVANLHGTRMFDLWCHLQDVRLAVGQKADVELSTEAGRQAARYIFGGLPRMAVKRVGMSEGERLAMRVDGAVALDGVIAVADGRAGWTEGEADDRVQAASGALLLVLAGRRAPEDWRADGVLAWQGELGDAFVRRARVFGG